MKTRHLKTLLSATGVSALLATAVALPLVSCSSNTYTQYNLTSFPSLLNDVNNQQREQLFAIINNYNSPNQQPNANQEQAKQDYIQANEFVLSALKNALNNQLDIDAKYSNTNYIHSLSYANNNQDLVIEANLNKSKYAFYCPRINGDKYFDNNNQASVQNINDNQ